MVTRNIPSELLSRLGEDLVLSGGTIRVAPGFENAGSIVRHLRFPEDAQAANQVLEQLTSTVKNNQQALESIGNTLSSNQAMMQGLQAMQQATMIMQGMNLAVSAAGFAIVIRQLKNISKKLDRMEQKLDLILKNSHEIKEYQQAVQLSRFTANLESLNEALRLEKPLMADQAIINLRESEHQFKHLCERQLQDVQLVYQNPESFHTNFMGTMGAAIGIASARAKMGCLSEANNIIDKARDWQANIKSGIFKPLEMPILPVWLGRLTDTEQSRVRTVVSTQRALPESLNYLSDTYQLCHQQGIDLESLFSKDKDHLLLITP